MRIPWSKIFIAAAVLVQYGVLGAGLAEAHKHLKLDVDLDETTMTVDPDGPEAFYIEGPIYPEGSINNDGTLTPGAESIGVFRCWGMLGPGVVSQEFDIEGRGRIEVQGLEVDGKRAVVGGTGDFRFVRGEGDFAFTFDAPVPGAFFFRVTFHLSGARR